MPPALRNVLAVVLGIVAGSAVNMGLVTLGPHVIPPPPGVDVTDTESLAASMHLFEARHFVFPFLAHALGTLVGALVAFLLARSHPQRLAFGIGAFFLLGGIAASFMVPAPAWFMALDLIVAYLPMAWLAILIGRRLRGDAAPEA
ncbi:MAG: hypothetical protein MI919_23290 [Holophagales bacterium]|nr:hypothetical protein [Holophagales bacterium]